MTKHDLQIQRLEAAVASIQTSRPDDDLPFLAPAELSLVERLERRIAQARGRGRPARERRALRADEDRRIADWERRLEAASNPDRRLERELLDAAEEELIRNPVPFYLDAWEHDAREASR